MSPTQGFAVWITGLPASGKSSITQELMNKLDALEVPVVVLESDKMRRILTPEPTYSDKEREQFYRAIVLIGELITKSGMNVIFDATANQRGYRDHARSVIRRFVEVYVDCPLEICMKRDPKGIYERAMSGTATTVPGVQSSYEPPLHPEVTLDGQNPPEAGAKAIVNKLKSLLYI
ncbi:MAG TPA: adenylyl-sulfate kinase [Nitrospirota bacterium]|nr:adenylyl-sulfate kinase [Nitrospirota bacterium]